MTQAALSMFSSFVRKADTRVDVLGQGLQSRQQVTPVQRDRSSFASCMGLTAVRHSWHTTSCCM